MATAPTLRVALVPSDVPGELRAIPLAHDAPLPAGSAGGLLVITEGTLGVLAAALVTRRAG